MSETHSYRKALILLSSCFIRGSLTATVHAVISHVPQINRIESAYSLTQNVVFNQSMNTHSLIHWVVFRPCNIHELLD